MDKIVTSLLGVSPSGSTATTGKPAASAELDDAAKAKLTEFRTHLTAYATAMSGVSPSAPPKEPDAAATANPPTSNPPTSNPTNPPTEPTQPPATSQPPTPAQTQPPAAEAPKVDQDAAKRHLTAARNSLSALTQLPAAAQLSGEARTQVSQLITNFNELITAQSNWSASYAKVSANLTALLGPDAGATSTTGTPGAVGTTGGGMTLDPAIREKLVELRNNLSQFEKAAGGGAAPAAQPDPTAPAKPATEPTEPPRPTTEPPKPTTEPTTPPAKTEPAPAQATSASDALTHLAAIEALLKAQNESGGLMLDKSQVEILRNAVAELRKILEKK
jgi:hypothetical protein